jgi:hypothetical protein
LWQSAFGGQRIVGDTVEVNGVRREVIGILPPGADVMDSRTQIWLPLGLNPANRQNRGNHYLPDRPPEGWRLRAAGEERTDRAHSELGRARRRQAARIRAAATAGRRQRRGAGAGHVLQMEPVQDEIVGSASRAIWLLRRRSDS